MKVLALGAAGSRVVRQHGLEAIISGFKKFPVNARCLLSYRDERHSKDDTFQSVAHSMMQGKGHGGESFSATGGNSETK